MSDNLADHLQAAATSITRDMDQLLGELKAPQRLVAAMQHAVLAGGKRIRPVLTLESTALLMDGQPLPDGAPAVAMAVECIHTYSLVHDDLPSMDNDDLRRGKPTVHTAFDQATAILAGDALQALAFELVATCGHVATPMMVRALATASGAAGMVGGQMLDLTAEGRFGEAEEIKDIYALAGMQAMKTGALIEVSCTLGGYLATATGDQREALARYGRALGLAFQISDDLLDVTATADQAGKRTGKDASAGKTTWPGLLGQKGANDALDAAITDAKEALAPFGAKANRLAYLAERLVGRTH